MRNVELARAEVVGAFIGDGFMNKYARSPIIEFSGDAVLDEAYFHTVLIPLLGKVFPQATPLLFLHSDCRCRKIRFNTYAVEHFFLDQGFSYGSKSHTVQIPSHFYFDQELLFRVVRGIFDTDGCVYVNQRSSYARPCPRITFTTVS